VRNIVGSVAAAAALTLTLAACGGTSTSAPKSTTSSTTTSSTTTPSTTGTSTVCAKVQQTLASVQTSLPGAASNPRQFSTELKQFVNQFDTETAHASGPVRSAVMAFTQDLQAAGNGHANVPKLTADAGGIASACSGGSSGSSPSVTS